jgi:hypothetical protein
MEEEEGHGHPRDGGRVKENIGRAIVGKDEVYSWPRWLC